jgi:hypothetical protein
MRKTLQGTCHSLFVVVSLLGVVLLTGERVSLVEVRDETRNGWRKILLHKCSQLKRQTINNLYNALQGRGAHLQRGMRPPAI